MRRVMLAAAFAYFALGAFAGFADARAGFTHPLAPLAIAVYLEHSTRQRRGLAGRHQEARQVVGHDFRVATHACRHHR